MQAQMPGNHPETSMYDEVSSLLKTRLAYHEWQLKHHQQRVNEIQDMYQYLNLKFGPQPGAAQPDAAQPKEAEITAGEIVAVANQAVANNIAVVAAASEVIETPAHEAQAEAVKEETVADESLLRPYAEAQHSNGEQQHQPMY
jgi:hypothetical protein